MAYLSHGHKGTATFEAPGVHDAATIGRMWTATRGGMMRCEWVAYRPAFMRFKVRASESSWWWAGSGVLPPVTMAAQAGYDLSDLEFTQLTCTEKSLDPMTMTAEYELMLPPIRYTGTVDEIVQTLDAADTIVQTLDAADTIVQAK